MKKRFGHAFFLTILVSVLAACTLLSSLNPQCAGDGDCTTRGGAFIGTRCLEGLCVTGSSDVSVADSIASDAPVSDPRVACIPETLKPDPTGRDNTDLSDITLRLVDFSRTELREGTGTFCRPLDTNCASPISTASFLDGSALLPIKAPESYADFVFRSPNTVTTYTSRSVRWVSAYRANAKLNDLSPDGAAPLTVVAGTRSAVTLLGATSPRPQDPAKGLVVFVVPDCSADVALQFKGLAGVSLRLSSEDATTSKFYTQNESPNGALGETTTDGLGGALNVPVGIQNLTWFLDGKLIATRGVVIRADTLNWIDLGDQTLGPDAGL